MQAGEHPEAVGNQCDKKHPPCLEDQEELNCDDPIDYEECVRHSGEHLWARQGCEHCAALKFFGHRILKFA